ncbi:MAG: peptidoglycan DD-metalloendopeptidase family protein [Actinobacteria bacterium]|nr:peptidoglycan DD-metalloendopeptidase family protein [Actinomycetota bacterium]
MCPSASPAPASPAPTSASPTPAPASPVRACVRRAPAAVLIVTVLLGGLVPVLGPALPSATAAASAAASAVPAAVDDPALPDGDWLWPVTGARSVVAPFRAPAHDYGPGHRGIDISAAGEVRAPADGVIAFRGVVVDRPLLTIDHGNGLVTTLEPVQSALSPGTAVRRGDAVAVAAAGGHAPAGTLHVGVRWGGAYINPMLLFGGVPRAVLLPCGAGGC